LYFVQVFIRSMHTVTKKVVGVFVRFRALQKATVILLTIMNTASASDFPSSSESSGTR
jgi:hypothetical protein